LFLSADWPVVACPVDKRHIEIAVAGHLLKSDVAANLKGHLCGLAFRQQLPPDQGMLFAYARDQIVAFWMMHIHIPLSIAFLDADGRILEIQDMHPGEPARRHVTRAAVRYAPEVNQGRFQLTA
jgi:uncharacterized membrane protein (UPF0127 family)